MSFELVQILFFEFKIYLFTCMDSARLFMVKASIIYLVKVTGEGHMYTCHNFYKGIKYSKT